MLNDFLIANREDLISRCRTMVVTRFAPSEPPPTVENGVPQFMLQLVGLLDLERHGQTNHKLQPQLNQQREEIFRTAAFHGVELLQVGYSIDQVVRDYGDLCQSVTEMAL